jgi:hypothetical protein
MAAHPTPNAIVLSQTPARRRRDNDLRGVDVSTASGPILAAAIVALALVVPTAQQKARSSPIRNSGS